MKTFRHSLCIFSCVLALPPFFSAPVHANPPVNNETDYKLLQAAAVGDTMAIRRMAPRGAALEAKDVQYGFTPLMWASWRAQIGTMRELIKRGAKVNAKSQFPGALSGVPNIVLRPSNNRTATGISFNLFVRNQGITPLMLAAASGSAMAMQELLTAGADVKTRTLSGESALDIASFSGSHNGVKSLLDKGAPLNDSTMAGYSPLLFATVEGHRPIVKLLLERGADATPLFFGRITLANLASGAGFSDISALLETVQRKQIESRRKSKGNQAKSSAKNTAPSNTVRIINSDGSTEVIR